jgi:hypothetical protein
MNPASQLQADLALVPLDQRELAEADGLSVPTIQPMQASEGGIRGNGDPLMQLVGTLDAAGFEPINEGAGRQDGGPGVRLKTWMR